MAHKVKKAVVPAAGLGTRFLPATKALPKEMLPVVDTPAIQYVVEEAVNAGLTDLLMVTGRNKSALENHFDRNYELESTLEAKQDEARLQKVTHSTDLAEIHYVRQGDPNGLGHAVLKAAKHVGREPFALLLGDDIIHTGDNLLEQMLDVFDETQASVVALMEVPMEQVSSYGVAVVERMGDSDVVRITGMVEKPSRDDAPSNLAIIGRYVLRPEVFDVLETTAPGRGGEIQLTDALATLAENPDIGGGVVGVIFRGRRFDTGDRLEYIKAVVELASERSDLGPELMAWLRGFVASK
jgi:UTP--glucose-1-phosphate uridylyltransferase